MGGQSQFWVQPTTVRHLRNKRGNLSHCSVGPVEYLPLPQCKFNSGAIRFDSVLLIGFSDVFLNLIGFQTGQRSANYSYFVMSINPKFTIQITRVPFPMRHSCPVLFSRPSQMFYKLPTYFLMIKTLKIPSMAGQSRF